MFTLKAVAVNGQSWDLHGPEIGAVFVEEGGMPSMWAQRSSEEVRMVGRDGVRRLKGVFNPIEGELQLVFRTFDGVKCAEHVREWLRAWDEPVTLVVGSAAGEFHAVARVPDSGVGTVWDSDPGDKAVTKMSWPFVIDAGLWGQAFHEPGPTVTVTNWGEGLVCPSIVWKSGGTVSINGGASFSLPTVPKPRRLALDVTANFAVTDPLTGQRDVELWKRIRGKVFTMPLNPGGTQSLKVPEGAVVEWTVGVSRPWR